MATFASVHYALQKEDRANPSRLSTPNVASGRVEFAYIPYALAGTEAANDIINLCVLPAGAVPIVPLCHVTCSADPGTTLTLDVGTAGDPDGLADRWNIWRPHNLWRFAYYDVPDATEGHV